MIARQKVLLLLTISFLLVFLACFYEVKRSPTIKNLSKEVLVKTELPSSEKVVNGLDCESVWRLDQDEINSVIQSVVASTFQFDPDKIEEYFSSITFDRRYTNRNLLPFDVQRKLFEISKNRFILSKILCKIGSIEPEISECNEGQERTKYLSQYISFEHDAQRVEKQDVLYRLRKLLEKDKKTIRHQYDAALKLYDSHTGSIEQVEGRFLEYLTVNNRLLTLKEEEVVLDGLALSHNLSLDAVKHLADFYELKLRNLTNYRECLQRDISVQNIKIKIDELKLSLILLDFFEKELKSDVGVSQYDQSALARLILLLLGIDEPYVSHYRNYFQYKSIRVSQLKNLINDEILRLTNQCRGESLKTQQIIFELCFLGLEQDLKAYDFEESYSKSLLSYVDFSIDHIDVHVKKLNSEANRLEKTTAIINDRLERREKLYDKNAIAFFELLNSTRLGQYSEEISGRSWADQATLARLVKALKILRKGEEQGLETIKNFKNANQATRDLLNGMIRHVNLFWSMTADNLDSDKYYFTRDDLFSPQQYLTERERLEFYISQNIAQATTPTGRFVPVFTLEKHQYNDPSPIQIRGGDNVLIQALQLKDLEMRRFQEISQERFIDGTRKKY